VNPLSRRGAIKLASLFAAAVPFRGAAGQTPVKPGTDKPAAAATVFEMTSFTAGSVDPDAAFAKALAAIAKSAADANKAGKPVPIVLNLEKMSLTESSIRLPSNSSAGSSSMATVPS